MKFKQYLTLAAVLLVAFININSGCPEEDAVSRSLSRTMTQEEAARMNSKITFALDQTKSRPRLEVQVSLVMPWDDLLFRLPSTFMRKKNLYERLEGFEVIAGDAEFVPYKNKSDYKRIKARAGEQVTFRYYVLGLDVAEPDRKESFSAPIVRDDYFQITGNMALAIPAIQPDIEYPLTIEWNLPAGFTHYTSFASPEPSQKVMTTSNILGDSMFLAGSKLKRFQIKVDKNPVDIVFNGYWPKLGYNRFVDVVQKLLKTQRDTLEDHNFPYFLVSFIDLRDENKKFAGFAHQNSFRAYLPRQSDQIGPQASHLISHELMHAWIGKIIKVGEGSFGIDGKWFTEGWTDYFGRVMALRAGVFMKPGVEDYFDSLNYTLSKYYSSAYNLSSLDFVTKNMYQTTKANDEIDQLPYQQGEIMAIELNRKIHEQNPTKSLDDVLKAMLAIARPTKSKLFKVAEIQKIVNDMAPGAFDSDYQKIVDGALLELSDLPKCAKAENVDRHIIQLGSKYQTFEFKHGGYVYDDKRFGPCRILYK
jgi:predicted metalloprotease with PDZ domain